MAFKGQSVHFNVSPLPVEEVLELQVQIFNSFKTELSGHIMHFKLFPLPILMNPFLHMHSFLLFTFYDEF